MSSAQSRIRSSRPDRHGSHPWVLAVVGAIVLVTSACVPPEPATPVGPPLAMDPTLAGGFFSLPWPNDIRKAPDGSLDLNGLPGVELLAGETPTILRTRFPSVVDAMAGSVTAFGTNTATHLLAPDGLSPLTTPSPSGSVDPDATVMLMDLDHPGERVPVLIDWLATGDRNRPDGLLTVLPYPGRPLRPATRYAVALFDGLRTNSGARPAPAPLIAALDQPWSPSTGVDAGRWDALRAQRDLVRSVVTASTDWRPEQLLAFTVFTTQDVTREMRAVADAVADVAPPALSVLAQNPCTNDPNTGGSPTSRLLGTVRLTRWQSGDYPYLEDGGALVVDAQDHAVPQGGVDVAFTASVPCGTPPAAGWPIMTFIDGTGGTYDIGSTTLPMSHTGYALFQIAPVYGAGRNVTLTPLMQQLGVTNPSQFAFYNFLNPVAARTNTIQQSAENLELLRAAATLTLAGPTLGTTGTVGIDAGTEVVTGQSQGAQTLPMVTAARPSIDGAVASAGSGGLYHTLSHLTGNRSFLGAMTGDAVALDELNPVVQIAQTVLEAGDGINFPGTTNYLQYNGPDDTCSPVENTRYLSAAIGLDNAYLDGQYRPWTPPSLYGDPAVDPPVVALPASGNVGGRTRVRVELPGGHYVAYDQKGPTQTFTTAIAAGQVPSVPAGPFQGGFLSGQNCPGTRWDVPPRLFAR